MSTHKPQSKALRTFSSLRKTLFIETSILLAFAITVTVVTAFFLAKSEMDARTFAQLQSIAHSKEELLENIISRQREQVAMLGRETNNESMSAAMLMLGFTSLLSLDADGQTNLLLGSLPPADELAQLTSDRMRSSTAFLPIISLRGWQSYMISATHYDSRGEATGKIVAVFDASPIVEKLLDVQYLGTTANTLLGVRQGEELVLLHALQGQNTTAATPLQLGNLADQISRELPLAKAVQGLEGSEKAKDYAGITVLAAYRSLPSIGWGIVVQIDQHEIFAPLLLLAARMGFIGTILVLLLSTVMLSLSRRIAAPLHELTGKLNGLESKKWRFERSIYTKNEIEQVDIAAFGLTRRLRESHSHLEDIVHKRTGALQEQHAQDDAIFQSIEYGLLVTNIHGEVILMNSAAQRITGWKHEPASRRTFDKILPIQDKDGHMLAITAHPIHLVLDTKKSYAPKIDQKYSLVRKSKEIMPLSLRVTPILRGRHCSGTVAVFRDITEERRIDHMKSEFISLVSHQLRTPLSSIRWYIEMLQSGDYGRLNPRQKEFAKEAFASNERMVRLVNALLNVSRIELGKLELNLETVNLSLFIEQIVKSFSMDTSRKRISVSFRFSNRISIRTDVVLLRLIIENLLSNAIKYSPSGSNILISVDANHPKGKIVVSVTDKGIGIPENQQQHVFEKMFRGTNALVLDTDGNGLGLYISNIAVHTIGAKLSFKSTEGKGTVFRLELPPDNNKGRK